MRIAVLIQNIRNILYRIKARIFYTSNISIRFKNLVWRPILEEELRFLHRKKSRVFDGNSTSQIEDSIAKERFDWENVKWSEQEDLIFEYPGKIIIEPTHGLAFTKCRKFLKQTRGHAHSYLYPSILDYLSYRIFKKRVTHYKVAIHFDGFVSKNLYHFFDDALNPLLLIINAGVIPLTTPILISERIYQLNHFQFFLKGIEPFKSLNWVVQKSNEWISVDRLYKADSSTQWWQVMYQLLSKKFTKNPGLKLFINRRPKYQRRLTNSDEVQSTLAQYGFQTVYAEDFSYEEQIKLFNEAEYIVAIHGAGITNIIYSEVSRLSMLEIFSKSYLGPHYYWLGSITAIKYYDAICGNNYDINNCFIIDIAKLEVSLKALLSYR